MHLVSSLCFFYLMGSAGAYAAAWHQSRMLIVHRPLCSCRLSGRSWPVSTTMAWRTQLCGVAYDNQTLCFISAKNIKAVSEARRYTGQVHSIFSITTQEYDSSNTRRCSPGLPYLTRLVRHSVFGRIQIC